jgi:ectoine hydroxylase
MKQNPQKIRDEFWTNGYVAIDGFFDNGLMDELHELIVGHFHGQPESCLNDEFAARAKTQIVPWFPQREGVGRFDIIDDDARLAGITAALLGDGWHSQYCMVMYSAQGTNGQAWHQDCPPETKDDYNLNRLLYTRDIVDEIGGQLMLVPRTHTGGALPAGEPHGDIEGQITLYPKKGTLVLIHGHCWHRVRPVHGGYRVSTNYRAAPANTPDDVTDVCVYRNMRYRFSTKTVVEDRLAAKS